MKNRFIIPILVQQLLFPMFITIPTRLLWRKWETGSPFPTQASNLSPLYGVSFLSIVSLTVGLLIGARWALARLVASYWADGASVREQRCVQASRCLTIVGTTGLRPHGCCVCERPRKKQRRRLLLLLLLLLLCCWVLVVDCS